MRIYPLTTCFALAPFAFGANTPALDDADFIRGFEATVHPFVQTYCVSCHGSDEPSAGFDMSVYDSMASVVKDHEHWSTVLELLEYEEMPPTKAKKHPSAGERQDVVSWLRSVRQAEMLRNAGDPGPVLPRRLSHPEFNYTVRDLTGADIQPAREFPIDPTNTAGFDNSGESLAMSPALMNKYLQAAREISEHMYLKADGFAFAPHPMMNNTDRDQFFVHRIIEFYSRQKIDYTDYFHAAWKYRFRTVLRRGNEPLEAFAAEAGLSPKYLTTIWELLEGEDDNIGPLEKLRTMWKALPTIRVNSASGIMRMTNTARAACSQMSDYVAQVRAKVEPRFPNMHVGQVSAYQLPMLTWKNQQYATHRMKFDPAQLQVAGEPPAPPPEPEVAAEYRYGPGPTQFIVNEPGDPDLAVPAGERARYEAAFARFCSVFPDMFYKDKRGLNYFTTRDSEGGRYLSSGFHNVLGYFRDDQPLYELILDEEQQRELDELWYDLDFVASVHSRMYAEFALGGTRDADVMTEFGEGPEVTLLGDGDYAMNVTREDNIQMLADMYMENARDGGTEIGIQAVADYFQNHKDRIREINQARIDAQPSHLAALVDFAERAYRRPLSADERNGYLEFYRTALEGGELDHEAAMRDTITSVLMSPDFLYRLDLMQGELTGIQPLSGYDLASRLSYFLWSSMPDAELLERAAAGDLHQPEVLTAQARRMLKDPRARALALEFGGNWLNFRRFDTLATVDRERFKTFDDDLREAMFEEPIRFLQDMIQQNRPVLDILYGRDTFVNTALAKHYGISEFELETLEKTEGGWMHIDNVARYERGGLLPMAAFLTQNAPGLRTSPVKRGDWVVKFVLGERVPPPPPGVPELPQDETQSDLSLRELLARHRDDPNCSSCHDRIDPLGLVFEGYGPIGERRTQDLAGRPIDASTEFPGGSTGTGLDGLRQYIRDERQGDFIRNLSSKLVAYALNRSLILSDEPLVDNMIAKLAQDEHRFESLVQSIITSPQFLNKRGNTTSLASN